MSRVALAGLVLLAAAAGAYALGPIPFPGAAYDAGHYSRDAHDAVLDEAVALVPPEAKVSVNNNVGAQLSARRVSYVFPAYEHADWVIVDRHHPFVFDREQPAVHAAALRSLEADARFERVYSRGGVAVFHRTAGSVP